MDVLSLCVFCSNLALALCCLTAPQGFRLVASSVLPIGKDTLKYGSQDAGHTVLAENEQLNNSFKIIMERLSVRVIPICVCACVFVCV